MRLGTADFYSVVENDSAVADSLVVHLEDPDGGLGQLLLFVSTADGAALDEDGRGRLRSALRQALSPRHVPDDIIEMPAIPRTLSGKKLEIPVKKILRGTALEAAVSPGSMANPNVAEAERVNPRTRRVQRAILDAARTVFMNQGADHVTAARVAVEADVARTTIYRHWPTSGELLLAVVDDFTAPGYKTVSIGDFEADLRSTLNSMCVRLAYRDTRKVFGALAAHAHDSQAFSAALRNFIGHLTVPITDVLDAGIEGGDLPSGFDVEAATAALAAPILHHHFMLHNELSPELVEAVLVPWLKANAS